MTIGIFFIRSVFCLTFLIFQTLFLGNSLVATASDTALNDRSIVTFTTTSLDNRFFTEGASVADLDLDGDIDLIAGPFWFEGPLFTQRHTFYETTPFDPQGYSNNFFSFTHDMNNDGFPDILVYGFPGKDASWFENPGKKEGLWKRHLVLERIDNESPTWTDLTGDGVPEILCSVDGFFGYAPINDADPTKPWTFHRISTQTAGGQFTHGLGYGDVDGDGRVDILEKSGWWQQPESLEEDSVWKKHSVEFSQAGGAQMFVRHVDADALPDVITSLSAHGFGLAWFRQTKGPDGQRQFQQYKITGERLSENPYRTAFSQIHAIDMADIDGDGLDDIVTGKRYWAHGPKGDPEPLAPAVLYWFRCTRGSDGKSVEFVPHLIDDNSGVGVQVCARDVSGDGFPDVLVGNKKGIFLSVQSRKQVSEKEWEFSQPKIRPEMANGLAPEEAARAMTVPPGFQVKLLACEPDVQQPIAMAFDDRGRLWVAEAYSYPTRVEDKDARDRILIFEDTDGDDQFDKRTVFQEQLNLVSGLEIGFGGVWVGAAPNLLFIPDRNGDDTPDGPPEILLDGWGWQDTHETLNAFTWGPDGWLYGCHGVFTHSNVGKPGTPDSERTKINAGIWRYHPQRHSFEVFSEGTSNPWGIDFNDHGHAFQTACVIPHLYHSIQGARYQRQAGQHFNPYTFDDIKTIANHRHWIGNQWNNPDRETSDEVGGGHAHAGAMIYLGGVWPQRYCGKLFMNNIHGARLNEDRLTPLGSGYVGDGEPDFCFANDSWSQFISLAYGPDGQVTVIDWYDRNQCHHHDSKTHDRGNGRIFKILYGNSVHVPVNLSVHSDTKLVELLLHNNEWFVRHARRLLQERFVKGSLAQETPSLLQKALAAATSTRTRLRALWGMHAVGISSDDVLLEILSDADPAVRGWAIQLAAEDRKLSPAFLSRCEELSVKDPSPVVRLALTSALQRISIDQRWKIVAGLLTHAEDVSDHNLPLMIWYAMEPLVPIDPARAIQLAISSRIPLVSRYITRRACSEEDSFDAAITQIVTSDDNTRSWMLEEAITALSMRGKMTMPKGWTKGYEKLQASPSHAVVRQSELVAVRFGDTRVLPKLRSVVSDRSADLASRKDALKALEIAKDSDAPTHLHSLLNDPEFSATAIASLASFDNTRTPLAIVAAYAELPSHAKQAAIATLTSRPAWTIVLLDAIETQRVPRNDLSAFTVGQLAKAADPKVLEKLIAVWGTIRDTPADRKAQFEKYRGVMRNEYLMKGNVSKGREIYAKTCGTCHSLYGIGGKIGPDLTGSNRNNMDYLLSNLLDPSALVGRDYQMTTILTTDGRSVAGIVIRENPSSVTLQTPTDQVIIATTDIDTRVLSTQSLMPENQLEQLLPDAARDLILYLRSSSQVPLPGEAPPSMTAEGTVAGAFEGEKARILERTQGEVRPQSMGGFPKGRWSDSSQLWWTGGTVGASITLEIPVTVSGRHEVFAALTKAHDYGIVTLSWDGGPASTPIDLFDREVLPTMPMSLGTFEVTPGAKRLVITLIGANEAATKSFMFGLDYIRLESRSQ